MPAEPAAPRDPIEARESAEQPAPRGRRRRRLRRLILAFLAFQLLVPLTYYLRADAYDERFAWRMFSAVRLHNCSPRAAETIDGVQQPIDLPKAIHMAWINHMARNRQDVVRAFMEKRCEGEDTEAVVVTNHCRDATGQSLRPQIYRRDCGSGEEEIPELLVTEDED